MSRFSGLPDPLAKGPAKPGARFTNIKEALVAAVKASPHSHTNSSDERLRALANGDTYTGRLGTTKSAAKAPAAPVAKSATPPVAKPAAAAQPPRKLGRAETVALALRSDPKLKGMEDIAIHMLDDDPDLKGLSGDGVVKCLETIDAAKYRADMAEEKRKASAAAADATWSRAIAKVHRNSRAADVARPKPQSKPQTKPQATQLAADKIDEMWSRAWARVCPSSAAQIEGNSTKGDDAWSRAWARVTGQQGAVQ